MKTRILFLIPALLWTGAALAQSETEKNGMGAKANLDALASGSMAVVPKAVAEGTVGSPYADTRWLTARLSMTNNRPVAPVPLKYDVLNSRLLMRSVNRPTDSLQLDDNLVAGFVLEEPALAGQPVRQRQFRRFAEAPQPALRGKYVEVLHQGRYTLLKQYDKVLRKAQLEGGYSSTTRSDEIADKNTYYLVSPDGKIQPVKLTMKGLQAVAPELAASLKAVPAAQSARTDADWGRVLAGVDVR
ncbi:hypothetical protein [Hymenobacter yonginensis]|uniref:Uncharacterized protein n=1 Tax=Hymenobacter yonginensis TaxID=748197 RepID=A0ABY7PRW4_9BACT|nr:hypothetical protein [Hymenobacter yonginensis]WBO85603.1 hypothetical protein O9Z63_05000 [Hymenobacter yonginensis]